EHDLDLGVQAPFELVEDRIAHVADAVAEHQRSALRDLRDQLLADAFASVLAGDVGVAAPARLDRPAEEPGAYGHEAVERDDLPVELADEKRRAAVVVRALAKLPVEQLRFHRSVTVRSSDAEQLDGCFFVARCESAELHAADAVLDHGALTMQGRRHGPDTSHRPVRPPRTRVLAVMSRRRCAACPRATQTFSAGVPPTRSERVEHGHALDRWLLLVRRGPPGG